MTRFRPFVVFLVAVCAWGLGGCASAPESRQTESSATGAEHANVRAATTADAATTSSVAQTEARANDVTNAPPRDAYVLLSGGGTPLSNNYSQYLQARAIAEFFQRECPPEATWVFFGTGNRPDEPLRLADARRELKRDGVLVQSWLPGVLPRNRPATREAFLRALREEILPTVRSGGTLYLFVGDHGELVGKGEQRESAITLWQLKQRRRSGEWFTDEREVLGVAELRRVLAEGLGRGRVVFGMTQCHGGGFHELGIASEMTPPREWFAGTPPEWAGRDLPGVRLRVAGFTATDEASMAAGCDADPDPERWAGYERFLPEGLLGLDLMTGERKGGGTRSLAEAHEAATLVDQTIDKPRASSEHYLEAWARLIETRLAATLAVTVKTREAITAYERAVDSGKISGASQALRERREQFARFTRQLAEQLPSARALLLDGSRAQLESGARGRSERGARRGNRRGAMAELRRTWNDTLRPAWKAAVIAGSADAALGAAKAFEARLLELEDGGRDFLLLRGANSDALMNEVYWESTYAEPATFDAAKAAAVTQWAADRRNRIVAWGKQSSEPGIRAAAEKIGPGPAWRDEPPRTLSQQTAAERVLFYRRVLAAWEFLETMRAEPALKELQTLIEIERAPVRRAGSITAKTD